MNITKSISLFFSNYFADKKFSKHVIPFLEFIYKIDKNKFENKNFETLNDWFKRDLKKISFKDNIPAISEGFLKVYRNINQNELVQIKGFKYSVFELIGNTHHNFNNGTMLIFRLEPKHYHNFHFLTDGIITYSNSIIGKYYPVNNLGIRYIKKLYCRNRRDITVVDTYLGNIAYIEVGALNVGSIYQFNKVGDTIKKYNKKGYFQFGGSTVILLFEADKISIKSCYSEFEKYVEFGTEIGYFL